VSEEGGGTALVIPARPCGTCPYAMATPSGVWAPEEYDKLPEYDRDTWAQPPAVFMCHTGDASTRVCKGWVACHGYGLLAYRLAVAAGRLRASPDDFDCPVPLHPSGAAAADAGRKEIASPSTHALRAIRKLLTSRAVRRGTSGGPDA
jgi:hypothetical protein